MSYIDTYKDGGIYSSLDYASIIVNKGLRFAKWLQLIGETKGKILCVGCGVGYEVVELLNNGFDAYGTEVRELDIPVLKDRIIKTTLPDKKIKDKEYDLLICCEVVEHLPPELTYDFLKDCKRISKKSLITIATVHDAPFNTHINIRSADEWIRIFEELGFNIENFQYKPNIFMIYKGGVSALHYGDGVSILSDHKDNI